MAAEASLAFFGIRYEVSEDEIEALEERSHPGLVAARKIGLKHYWGNFGAPGEQYLLFVGASLGVIGVEGANEVQLPADQLSHIIADTTTKLRRAGFLEQPALYFQRQPEE